MVCADWPMQCTEMVQCEVSNAFISLWNLLTIELIKQCARYVRVFRDDRTARLVQCSVQRKALGSLSAAMGESLKCCQKVLLFVSREVKKNIALLVCRSLARCATYRSAAVRRAVLHSLRLTWFQRMRCERFGP